MAVTRPSVSRRGGAEQARRGREAAARGAGAAGHRVQQRRLGVAAGLTERELEVLLVLVRGDSNREIGERLGIGQDRRTRRPTRLQEGRCRQSRRGDALGIRARARSQRIDVNPKDNAVYRNLATRPRCRRRQLWYEAGKPKHVAFGTHVFFRPRAPQQANARASQFDSNEPPCTRASSGTMSIRSPSR
ncbi:MAG: hypothetical protein QOF45_1795 [Gaiellaceae bacterium]|nr:hypothetical protein [Gaiellaceae bacterium]